MLYCKLLFALALFALFSTPACKGDVVQELTRRFNDEKMECIDQHNQIRRPAYECSGLIIRGVRYDDVHRTLRYPWSLKSRNKEKKSFSMTFLRRDVPFDNFPSGYDSGFIVYPHLKTPRGKRSNRVYCAFPLDGHTDGRGGKHGCGQSRDDRYGSSLHCDAQGISSFNKWKKHYYNIRKSGAYFVRRQCAFDMTLPTAARDFAIVIQANNFIRTNRDAKNAKYSYRVNEILVDGWDDKNVNEIPIEAFFYLVDSHGARNKAEMYQTEYYQKFGETKPVIGIRLPSKNDRNLSIVQHTNSQPRTRNDKRHLSDNRKKQSHEQVSVRPEQIHGQQYVPDLPPRNEQTQDHSRLQANGQQYASYYPQQNEQTHVYHYWPVVGQHYVYNQFPSYEQTQGYSRSQPLGFRNTPSQTQDRGK